MSHLPLVRNYLQAVAAFAHTPEAFLAFVHPDAEWIEHPNALNPTTVHRDLAATCRGAEAGRQLLREQTFALGEVLEQGDQLVLQADWTGTVGVDRGPFRAGQELKAHFAVWFTFRDGKIVRQVNYDCFEAFSPAKA